MPIPTNYPNIFGNYDSRDLVRPVLEVGQADIYKQIREVLAAYEETTNAVIGTLADRGTTITENYAYGAGGGFLQPSAEFGQRLATRVEYGEFQVGYPIARYSDRAMFTPEYLLRATVADVQAKTVDALIKDQNTLWRGVVAAMFDNTNYSFVDPADIGGGQGTLGVKRLFNADSSEGHIFVNGVQVDIGTLNHYKTSGSGSFNTAAFTLAKTTLKDVGLGSDVVYFISEADELTVRALADFIPVDPDNGLTIAYNPLLQPTRSIVKNPKAIGVIKNLGEVVMLSFIPTGYIVAMDRNADKPVFIRESDLAELRGFKLTGDEVVSENSVLDGPNPMLNKYWSRIFGAGVRNRANAVVVQITASGSYTAPTF